MRFKLTDATMGDYADLDETELFAFAGEWPLGLYTKLSSGYAHIATSTYAEDESPDKRVVILKGTLTVEVA